MLRRATLLLRWRLLAAFIPLVAIAAALLWLALPDAEDAAATSGGPSMALNIEYPTGHCDDADNPTKCTFPTGTLFTVAIIADNPPAEGYYNVPTALHTGDLSYEPRSLEDEVVWPDGQSFHRHLKPSFIYHALYAGSGSADSISHHVGSLVEVDVRCPEESDSIVLALAARGPNFALGSAYGLAPDVTVAPKAVAKLVASGTEIQAADHIDINCVDAPTFTPTPTPTGPTATPTATPTPPPTPSGVPQMVLNVKDGTCDDDEQPTACQVVAGEPFTLSIDLLHRPQEGYFGFQTFIRYGDLVYVERPIEDEIVWPDGLYKLRSSFVLGEVVHGDLTDLFPPFSPSSFFEGHVIELSMTCQAQPEPYELLLQARDPEIFAEGAVIFVAVGSGSVNVIPLIVETRGDADYADVLDIECVEATPTPTPTFTPENPSIQKGPALQNLWLTAQARDVNDNLIKIPGASCLGSSDAVELEQRLDVLPGGLDKAGDPREVGAFSFEVHYDNEKVCVEIAPGALPAAWAAQAGAPVCTVEDSATKPALQGVATIHCNKPGKDDLSPPLADPDDKHLATVIVRPQPEEYSISKPNNGNGNVVQLLNTTCKLGDEQGDPIVPPVGASTCTDASITIRYLEGDVDPDCVIDSSDAQSIAFRWNVEKGTLLYLDRMNLEPSGAQADDDIDVLDLQFVYGRFGSTCAAPHPAQPPVNPTGP